MNLKNLKLIHKIILALLPFLVIILVYVLFFMDEKIVPQESNKLGVILPQGESITDTITNKKELYNSINQENSNRQKESEENSRISLEDILNAEKNKPKETPPVEEQYKTSVTTKKAPVVQEKPVAIRKSSNVVKASKPVTQITPTKIESSPKKEYVEESGFGVYYANNSGAKTKSATSNSETSYIPAILESTQKIKSGSEIVFIMSKPCTIDGVKYEKSSIMFGFCTFSNNRIHITINTIQDTKGKKHSVELMGYNENYQQGIYVDNKIDNTLNQSTTSTVGSTSGGDGLVGKAVSTGTNIATTLLTKDKNEVTIKGGYRMFFR